MKWRFGHSKSMMFLRFVFLLLCCVATSALAKHPVVLISLDGFAQRYLQQYQPQNIKTMMQQGIATEALLPVFPSKTFPNHLSLITGCYTAKHGIIHNSFYRRDTQQEYYKGAGKDDASWLSAMPLWALAESQGVKSAVYFWPESEAKYNGLAPSYNFPYDKETPNEKRIKQIVQWLQMPKGQRPEFIASYFSLVDSAGHHFGPNSAQVKTAVAESDRLLGTLFKALQQQVSEPVNVILVSDHGMTAINSKQQIEWQQWSAASVPALHGAKVINGQTQLLIYSESLQQKAEIYRQLTALNDSRFHVERRGQFPAHWHWQGNDNVLPDIVLDVVTPYTFAMHNETFDPGSHGFDPLHNKDMEAIFIAKGPNFKTGVKLPAFENIHVFPMIAELLGLKLPANIDGKASVLQPYLMPDK